MRSVYIVFDLRSGRIIGMHNGPVDPVRARQHARHYAKVSEEHVAVIEVASDALERGKQYKIDVSRKEVVETASGERGASFGFGKSGSVAAK